MCLEYRIISPLISNIDPRSCGSAADYLNCCQRLLVLLLLRSPVFPRNSWMLMPRDELASHTPCSKDKSNHLGPSRIIEARAEGDIFNSETAS